MSFCIVTENKATANMDPWTIKHLLDLSILGSSDHVSVSVFQSI